MRYAVISNGTVENVIEWDGETDYTTSGNLIQIDDEQTVSPGDTYDGATFTRVETPEPEVEPIELQEPPT